MITTNQDEKIEANHIGSINIVQWYDNSIRLSLPNKSVWNDLEIVLLDDELLLLEEDVDSLGLGQLVPGLPGQDGLVVVVPAQLGDLRQAITITSQSH